MAKAVKQNEMVVELPDDMIVELREHVAELGPGWTIQKAIEAAVRAWLTSGEEDHASSVLEDIINTLRAHGHEVDGE